MRSKNVEFRSLFLASVLSIYAALASPLAAQPATNPIEELLALTGRMQADARTAATRIARLDRALHDADYSALGDSAAVAAERRKRARLEDEATHLAFRIAHLNERLTGTQGTALEILPLLTRMTESLAEFVRLDLPFRHSERLARVGALQSDLGRADRDVAQKLLQVLEAYRDELRYGREVSVYRGVPESANGRVARLLQVGRIALYYLSLDGREAAVWDPRGQHWRRLGSRDMALVQAAFDTADSRQPALLSLPAPAAGIP